MTEPKTKTKSKKPGGPGKIHEHPNWRKGDFSVNPQNCYREGRPKKILSIIKDHGFSKDDLRTAIETLAWQTEDEINQILADELKPIILHVVARAYLTGAKSGDFVRVKELVEYIIGKPTQHLELDANVSQTDSLVDLSFLPDDLLQQVYESYKLHKAKRLN